MYYNNRRLALSIFWVIAGAVLLALSIAEKLDSTLYAGMGGALIAVGVLQVMRNLKYRKDPAYREKIDTEAGDERNRFLRGLSWSWAGYVTILVEGVGVIVAMVMGQRTVMTVLSYSVCLILCVYWIAYLVLNKKY